MRNSWKLGIAGEEPDELIEAALERAEELALALNREIGATGHAKRLAQELEDRHGNR